MASRHSVRRVLKQLLERGENVIAVYCAPDSGSRPNPLKQTAESAGIPVFQPASYKTAEVADEMRKLNADLCLMALCHFDRSV